MVSRVSQISIIRATLLVKLLKKLKMNQQKMSPAKVEALTSGLVAAMAIVCPNVC